MMAKLKAWLAAHSPSGNALGVQIILVIAITLFTLTFCSRAKGAELDVLLGSTVVRGPTGVAALNVRFPNAIAGVGALNVGFDLIGESSWRCAQPLCNQNQAVVHAQAVSPPLGGVEIGVGVAKLQHSDNYNSGAINFSLSLERQVYKDIYVRYQHFSNAGTSAPNEGRDILLIGWRFK